MDIDAQAMAIFQNMSSGSKQRLLLQLQLQEGMNKLQRTINNREVTPRETFEEFVSTQIGRPFTLQNTAVPSNIVQLLLEDNSGSGGGGSGSGSGEAGGGSGSGSGESGGGSGSGSGESGGGSGSVSGRVSGSGSRSSSRSGRALRSGGGVRTRSSARKSRRKTEVEKLKEVWFK
jgi:hypothetical protein